MSENIEWPQDPPQDGDQITIGNTTFAWNDDPGIWVGFVNATTESGSGGTTEDLFTPASTTRVDLNSVTVPAGTWSMHVGLNDNSNAYTLTLPTTNMVGLTASLSGSILGGFVFNGTNYDYAYTKEGTNNDFESRTGQTTIPLFGGLGGGTGLSMIFTCSGDVTFSTDEGARWLYTPLNLGGTTTNNNTTVNIGGGGGGMFSQFLAEIQNESITTSKTIEASDFTYTGPAWIIVSGGGGGGTSNVSNGAAAGDNVGGDGGAYGFVVDDVMDLVGGVLSAGSGGTGGAVFSGGHSTYVNPGASLTNNGSAGSTTTFSHNGYTITATAGAGGTSGSDGSAGTASASGGTPPTQLTVEELNALADTYWADFVVANTSTGELTIASFLASIQGAQGGAAGVDSSGPPWFAVGGTGGAGGIYILYQQQA